MQIFIIKMIYNCERYFYSHSLLYLYSSLSIYIIDYKAEDCPMNPMHNVRKNLNEIVEER